MEKLNKQTIIETNLSPPESTTRRTMPTIKNITQDMMNATQSAIVPPTIKVIRMKKENEGIYNNEKISNCE